METVHEVDLKTMIPSTNRTNRPLEEGDKKQTVAFKDGELIICAPKDIECVQTAESYSFPLRIDVTVKTDSSNIRLYYKEGRIILNWEINKDEMKIHDILTGRGYGYHGKGRVLENEFVDITWILDKNEMLLLVNEELRQIEDDFPYMTSRAVNLNKKICEPFRISAAWGSTVTVKSLKITELE